MAISLTKGELVALYKTNGVLTLEEEQNINLLLPEPGQLLSPLDFAQRVKEQTQFSGEGLHYREDLWFSRNVNAVPESLYTLQERFEQEIKPIKDLTGWNMAAITAGCEGGIRLQIWEDLLNEIQQAYQLAERAQWYILKYAPVIPQTVSRTGSIRSWLN